MRILISILLVISAINIFAQGEIDSQKKIFYRNERTFAFLLNSNGYGVNYRFGKRRDAFRKTLYEVELNYLKHPKEVKVTIENNRNITYGKLNATYTLKGAIGFQKEMFQKRDQGGISIRYFINIGPTFAILKPIYYEYYSTDFKTTYFEKFNSDPAIIAYIAGKASYSMGFSEIKIQPGIYTKFGYTFEYSKADEVFHAIELGVSFDAYAGKVPIMATPSGKLLYILPNDQFFLALFISYRFGRIINTRFNPKQNKIDNIIAN